MIQIVYSYQSEEKEKAFDNGKTEILIGRPDKGKRIDLDLTPDLGVSRVHARIWAEEGQYWIEDLGSKYGTKLNGEEIQEKGRQPLQSGDAVQIGVTKLQVTIKTERAELEVPIKKDEGQKSALPKDSEQTPRLIKENELEGPKDGSIVLQGTLLPEESGTEPDIKIAEVLDADVLPFDAAKTPITNVTQRLLLLYELPLLFGKETQLDRLLQTIVEKLVEAIPGAERGALLLKDRENETLLLKTYLSSDRPAVSKTLALRAMTSGKGFIWRKGGEVNMSVSILQHKIETGMYAPLIWKGEALGVICVDNQRDYSIFAEEDLRLMMAIAHYAAMAVANYQLQDDLRYKTKLLERLLTNFSPKIRERLLERARHGSLRPGGKRSEVTILYSDIRGFSKISAGRDVEEVADILNAYFSALVEVLFKFDGTIDKFVGDSILAVFGSPEFDPKQHEKAIRAALEMQVAMKKLSITRLAQGQVTCEIGIGIHCGEVLHGFIGAAERIEFTVIGDAVNRASRYCDSAGAGEILISPEVYQRVWAIVQAEKIFISTKHEGDLTAHRVMGLKT
jgi:adenylate cyclase